MFIFMDGFDLYTTNLTGSWVTNTIVTEFVPGRVSGNAASFSANGLGIFMAVYALPASFTEGVLGIALNLLRSTNSISIMFYNGNQEQCSVTLVGCGQIISTVPGQMAVGQTGMNNFDDGWNYFEICPSFNNKQLTINVNGNPIFSTSMKPNLSSFNRIVFSVPENQNTPITVDDLRFDDQVRFLGDTIVATLSPLGKTMLPYYPETIFAAQINSTNQLVQYFNQILPINPITNLPWTIWQLNSFENDQAGFAEILISTARVNLLPFHTVMSD